MKFDLLKLLVDQEILTLELLLQGPRNSKWAALQAKLVEFGLFSAGTRSFGKDLNELLPNLKMKISQKKNIHISQFVENVDLVALGAHSPLKTSHSSPAWERPESG